MNRTWLVQRLKKPYVNPDSKLSQLGEVFSFGGGMVNGGLSNEAMSLLRPHFSFDYMGSAEFEFGAVPKSLSHIVKNRNQYTTVITEVAFETKDWKSKKELKGAKPILVICEKNHVEEVQTRLATFAKNTFNNTKEMINLDRSLADCEYDKDTIGWLELDNHFLFFKNIKTGETISDLLLRS
jgi:hypothetical protein